MENNDLSIVCLFYEPKRLRHFINVLRALKEALMPREIIFVVNNASIDLKALSRTLLPLGEVSIIRHDNEGMEFGGYQAGVNAMTFNRGGVLVVNDTVGVHDFVGPKKLRATSDQILSRMDPIFSVGEVCVDINPISIFGHDGIVWLRSNLFYLNFSSMKAIGRKLYCSEVNEIVNEKSESATFISDAADPRIMDLLNRWLFKPGPAAWYRAQPLDEGNWNFMAKKARSILQERYLSMRLIAAGSLIHSSWISPRSMIYDKAMWRLAKATGR